MEEPESMIDDERHTRSNGLGRTGKALCFSCSHFFITYDVHFPYGCRAIGFKSKQIPSLSMYFNSGIECQAFSEKNKDKNTKIVDNR